MNEKQLLQLKKEIDDAKSTADSLRGQRDLLMKELKNNWGCKTLKEAEKKLQEMDEEIKSLVDLIDEGAAGIEKSLKEIGR